MSCPASAIVIVHRSHLHCLQICKHIPNGLNFPPVSFYLPSPPFVLFDLSGLRNILINCELIIEEINGSLLLLPRNELPIV